MGQIIAYHNLTQSLSVAAQLPVPTSITYALVQAKSVTLTIQVSGANGKTLRTVFTSSNRHTVQLSGTVSSNFAILQVNGLHPGTTYTVRAFVVEGSTQGQAKVSTVTTKADGELHSISYHRPVCADDNVCCL